MIAFRSSMVASIFISLVTAIIIGLGSNAQAATGTCYFDGSSCNISGSFGACGTNDMLTGRNTSCSGSAMGAGMNKPQFIAYITARYNGSAHNHTGAKLLMAKMLGDKTPSLAYWTQLMNSDDVYVYYDGSGYAFNNTSFYDPNSSAGNPDAFFLDHPGVRPGYHINIGGTVASGGVTWGEIERDCGNTTGDTKKIIQVANLIPRSGPYQNIPVGQTAWFQQVVDAENVAYPYASTFSYAIGGYSPGGGTANVGPAPGGRRVDSVVPFSSATRGSASRSIWLTGWPTYANAGGASGQTIDVYGWDLGVSVNPPATAFVGQPMTFQHWVWNGGGATTNMWINGDITGPLGNDFISLDRGPGIGAGGVWGAPINVTAPPTRGLVCSNVSASPRADNNGSAVTAQGCTNVLGWGVQGISTVSNAVVVEGTSVTFTHTIINNDASGGAPTTVQINLDIKDNAPPNTYAAGNVDCTVPAGLPFGGSNSNCKITIPNLPAGVYCQRIGYGQIADNNGAWADSANACVTVVALTPTVSVSDHEKGFGNETINHGVVINPCPAVGVGTVTFNINISGREGNGVVYNNAVPVTLGNGNCTYNHPAKIVNGTWLDSQSPGTSITYATNAILDNMLIYEVPYARFTGQDVRACSDASANRFMWDQRPTGTASYGSNSQYASFFKTGNTDGTYTGLNTLAGAAMNRLRANWSGLTAPNCSTPSATIANTSAGDVFLGGSGISTVTVSLIKTPANIYIHPETTTLNGILIASGNIYTCATSSTAPARSDWELSCRNRLVVNGALYANTVVFQRSVGSRYLNPATDGPAEIVNFPASLNFTDIPGMPDSSSGKYSSFRSVSPRL